MMERKCYGEFSLACIFLVLSAVVSTSQSFLVDDRLMLSSNGSVCHKYVCDPSDVLTVAEALTLGNLTENTASEFKCKTCSCSESANGLMIGIGTVSYRNYSSNNETVQNMENFEYARRVLKNWNLSGCGNDILLLLIKDTSKLIITYGEVAKKNVPSLCAEEVSSSATDDLSNSNYYKALYDSLWAIRTVYRNSDAKNWPECFGKTSDSTLSPTVIVLIVLSILVVFGIVAFIIWHVSGQKKLRYLNYNPNNHVRFNNYAGMTDFGTTGEATPPPSTVTTEYAMWQGSVSEGTFDNPGFEERRGSMRAC